MARTPYNPDPALRASVTRDGERLSFPVPVGCDGLLAGTFLRQCGVSQKTVRSAKRLPLGLTMDGEHIRTVDPVRAGATISITTGDEPRGYLTAEGIDIPVLYEDEHLIAFHKPAGLNTHPSNRDARDSLLNYAHQHFADRPFRPLTRLDKTTSGVLLVAKSAFAATAVRTLPSKDYLAIVQGDIQGSGTVDLPIARSAVSVKQRVATPQGAPSRTHYRALAQGGGCSLMLVRLETGRTHQIRVHFTHMGHPLLGDDLYGGPMEAMQRTALHCLRLGFVHPFSGAHITIEAPPPADFDGAVKRLFKSPPEVTIW